MGPGAAFAASAWAKEFPPVAIPAAEGDGGAGEGAPLDCSGDALTAD